ncbi:MAG: homocysteine S-methyltransferase family protein [Clostridia bacterium]|nr:homocysteine S-methyltransferase family protein [Clostridia bacterium]
MVEYNLLHNDRILLFDGGMGSLLVKKGLAPGEKPEYWNLSHPEAIEEIHTAYIAAGADIINTNTFGAYRHKLGDDTERVILAAIDNAKRARDKAGRDVLIALDMGPSGKLLAPLGELAFEEAVAIFAETVKIGAPHADLILIETMGDLYELKAAVLAAKENSDLPIIATVALDERGKLMTGADVETVVALLEGLGVSALGVNCGFGPEKLLPFVKRMAKVASIPLVVTPNAGLPAIRNGETVYDLSPEAFAEEMKSLLFDGVFFAGGCCGTTPDHIAALKAVVDTRSAPVLSPKQISVVSSYTHTVTFGKEPVLIGERLNPTGKARLKAALREGDLGYLATEGIAQCEKGAMILDVNVGLPELDEPQVLCEAVKLLQEVCDAPLQIDTANRDAMEKACRLYNGKPLLNSVNGAEDSMRAIFPIAKKYGGMVVALTLDENGIPNTVEGRVAIADKILSTAKTYGLCEKDLIFDPLALTVSSDSNAALVTLGTVKALHERGLLTSLGVSNVSFGLPERDRINGAFFTMALSAGLSAAIMNPFSDAMMNAYRTYRVLGGLDTSAADYIASLSEKKDGVAIDTLKGSVIKGLSEKAAFYTKELLKEKDALSVVNEDIIPALDEVGRGFESGKTFLPQLLAAAEAAKAAFEAVKDAMPKGKTMGEEKKVILATVKGDIHDIGKNIVKVMLENYGYTVIDLGRDVAPEAVVEAVKEHDVKLVGLSALMTTTVSSMEETIKALKKEGLTCKVVVGGAVLNREYADMIGADRYAKDAAETVRYADEVFS